MSTGQQLKEWADLKADFETNRLTLKERVSEELHVPYNGGLFKAGPEMIAFLSSSLWLDEICVEDSYGNPIKINPKELVKILGEAYTEAMNSWLIEFEELKRIRKGSDV